MSRSSRSCSRPSPERQPKRFLRTAMLGAMWGTMLAAAVLAPGSAAAEALRGTIEKVENEGRSVTIAGTVVAVSGSRTNICIAGVCDRDRAMLKTGMTCQTDITMRDGKPEARRLSCR